MVINFLTEWYCVSFGLRVEIFYAFINREHFVVLKSCWIFIYPYFESGSREESDLVSTKSVRIGVSLYFVTTCTKYNPSYLRAAKTYNRLWIIFSRLIHVGEFTNLRFNILWENFQNSRFFSIEFILSGPAS